MTDPDITKSTKSSAPIEDEASPNEIMGRVMLGLGVWGLILGIGAALFGVGDNGGIELGFRPLRGMIVWGCVGGFLGFWGLLLRSKRRGE